MDLTYRFRDCSCPGTPHPNGDTVTYPPKLPFDVAAQVIGLIWNVGDVPTAQNAFPLYLKTPVSWNLVGENGAPVPLTEEALDALDFADQYEIADYADTLYRGTVLSPLVRRMSRSSETGPTTATSPRRTKR